MHLLNCKFLEWRPTWRVTFKVKFLTQIQVFSTKFDKFLGIYWSLVFVVNKQQAILAFSYPTNSNQYHKDKQSWSRSHSHNYNIIHHVSKTKTYVRVLFILAVHDSFHSSCVWHVSPVCGLVMWLFASCVAFDYFLNKPRIVHQIHTINCCGIATSLWSS